METAYLSRDSGFASMTLQAGERTDGDFVAFVERIVGRIKRETRTSELPEGLGITLCVGEQTRESYARFFDAGAHRYLLRIETSNERLFARLHPSDQPFSRRVEALYTLKEIGYQLGTGVMIGLPGQTEEDLARDIAFFRECDADMIGMGPYIASARACEVHRACNEEGTLCPARSDRERLLLALRMIAGVRIYLRDVNIAATTALQALSPTGREAGLMAGANVLMPIVTPRDHRGAYQLYDGKPCIDEDSLQCGACTPLRAARVRRPVVLNAWGDAPMRRAGKREERDERTTLWFCWDNRERSCRAGKANQRDSLRVCRSNCGTFGNARRRVQRDLHYHPDRARYHRSVGRLER